MKSKLSVTPPNAGTAAYFRFVILLLPAAAASSSWLDVGRLVALPSSRPYLAVLGPSPLHFAAAAAPPDPVLPPALPVTPAVVEAAKPVTEGVANKPDVVPPVAAANSPVTAEAQNRGTASTPSEAPAPKPANRPPPILRDEFSPTVRTEDLLPFFAFPPGRREGGLASPGQVVPPPSSATYRQQ